MNRRPFPIWKIWRLFFWTQGFPMMVKRITPDSAGKKRRGLTANEGSDDGIEIVVVPVPEVLDNVVSTLSRESPKLSD